MLQVIYLQHLTAIGEKFGEPKVDLRNSGAAGLGGGLSRPEIPFLAKRVF